jgi:hypothetical protein
MPWAIGFGFQEVQARPKPPSGQHFWLGLACVAWLLAWGQAMHITGTSTISLSWRAIPTGHAGIDLNVVQLVVWTSSNDSQLLEVINTTYAMNYYELIFKQFDINAGWYIIVTGYVLVPCASWSCNKYICIIRVYLWEYILRFLIVGWSSK